MSGWPELRSVLILAAPDDNIPASKGPEWGKAAPIGLLIIVLLGVAVVFLVKSMNRNLRKVPASFDPPADPEPTSTPDGEDHDPDAQEASDQAPSEHAAAETPGSDGNSDSSPDGPPQGVDDQGQDVAAGTSGRTTAEDR